MLVQDVSAKPPLNMATSMDQLRKAQEGCRKGHRGRLRRGQGNCRQGCRPSDPDSAAGSYATLDTGRALGGGSERPIPPRGGSRPPACGVGLASIFLGCLAPRHPATHLGFARRARILAGGHSVTGLVRPAVLARLGMSERCCEERGQEGATSVRRAPVCKAQPHGQNRGVSDDRQPCGGRKDRLRNRRRQSGKVPKI
jgi:hypothetical protein